jgi:hypothetical protein
MGWRRLTPWSAVGVGIEFVAAEVFLLDVRIRDFDEGVYWQSIRALARGEPLFRSVYASQPALIDLTARSRLQGTTISTV